MVQLLRTVKEREEFLTFSRYRLVVLLVIIFPLQLFQQKIPYTLHEKLHIFAPANRIPFGRTSYLSCRNRLSFYRSCTSIHSREDARIAIQRRVGYIIFSSQIIDKDTNPPNIIYLNNRKRFFFHTFRIFEQEPHYCYDKKTFRRIEENRNKKIERHDPSVIFNQDSGIRPPSEYIVYINNCQTVFVQIYTVYEIRPAIKRLISGVTNGTAETKRKIVQNACLNLPKNN